MQICGLVLEFDPQCKPPSATLWTLSSWPHCTLGQMQAHRLPVVLEANDPVDTQFWHDSIATLDGVQQVQVAYVAFDNESESDQQQETSHVA